MIEEKKIVIVNLLLSSVAGATIWAISPDIAGTLEPWDSEWPYYSCALALAGFFLGFFRPQKLYLHYAGVVYGQLVYILIFLPRLGPLFLIGIMDLASFSLILLLGAYGGAKLRELLSHRFMA